MQKSTSESKLKENVVRQKPASILIPSKEEYYWLDFIDFNEDFCQAKQNISHGQLQQFCSVSPYWKITVFT